jgi:hypothetical protein
VRGKLDKQGLHDGMMSHLTIIMRNLAFETHEAGQKAKTQSHFTTKWVFEAALAYLKLIILTHHGSKKNCRRAHEPVLLIGASGLYPTIPHSPSNTCLPALR